MNELVTVTKRDGRVEVTPVNGCDIEPSLIVVAGIAEIEGLDGNELRPPLADYVDPGALDALIDGLDDGLGSVQFTAWGYHITVGADLGVSIRPGATETRVPRSEPASDH